MPEIVQSATFSKWLSKVADRGARARIFARIDRLAMGNPGDVKPAGHGVSEMRIDYGPGYRVYLMRSDAFVTVLLCGGDKRTQSDDIKRALAIAKDWRASQASPKAPGDKKAESRRKDGKHGKGSATKPHSKRK